MTFPPLTHPVRKAPEPMLRSHSMRLRSAILCFAAAIPLFTPCIGYGKPNQSSAQLAFGVDMARHGLWKEALFRFQEAEKLDPENPRIQSNLGVAAEAAGQFDKALGYYQKALRLAPNDKGIRTNYTRFVEFYQGFKGQKDTKKGSLTMPAPSKPPAPAKPEAGAVPPAPPPPNPAAPPQAAPAPKPSTPEDTPPPPADNRPPRQEESKP
ncbi:MAG TPA: tetratricopeptide repeat protein [Thermoanaerobaculia bacterium]|nr:tetratricopeptide repeat protein [Thermoanaerobaculia bacterium]